MSWYQGDIVQVAGSGIAVLSEKLLLNDHWSIHDDLGGNVIVYKNNCPGENSLFYLHIDDTNTTHMLVRMWDGWDEVTHAGTGKSTTACWFNKGTGYGLAVNNTRLIWCSTTTRQTFYAGQPTRFNEALNTPVIAGNSSYATQNYGMAAGQGATNAYCACLNDPDNLTVSLRVNGYTSLFNAMRSVGTGWFIVHSLLFRTTTPYPVLGYWDGAVAKNRDESDCTDLDIITINGVSWEVFMPGTIGATIVRKS